MFSASNLSEGYSPGTVSQTEGFPHFDEKQTPQLSRVALTRSFPVEPVAAFPLARRTRGFRVASAQGIAGRDRCV